MNRRPNPELASFYKVLSEGLGSRLRRIVCSRTYASGMNLKVKILDSSRLVGATRLSICRSDVPPKAASRSSCAKRN